MDAVTANNEQSSGWLEQTKEIDFRYPDGYPIRKSGQDGRFNLLI
jgi:hypothetical protein